MHLVRISVSKDARIQRDTALSTLTALLGKATTADVFPGVRGPSDAVRTAAAYALIPWRRFVHQGKQCEVLAKSPESTSTHGLNLHIHVCERTESKVGYSALVVRLSKTQTQSTPETIREESAHHFPDLVAVLDAATLVQEGQRYLYDNDLRKLLSLVLQPVAFKLWPGVSLVLQDHGVTLARDLERVLGACLASGSLSVSLIALDMSQANREALARELAEELTPHLEKLTDRCGYTAPNSAAIQRDYEALAEKISQAETLLGVPLPLLGTQMDTETAIMALA